MDGLRYQFNMLNRPLTKTKEMVVDSRRTRTKLNTISILGEEVEVVGRYTYFNVCSKMWHVFYQSVVASEIFFATICRGSSIRADDFKKLNKLV